MSHGRKTTCRKSCCWNPFGTCGRAGNCACHGYRDRDEDAEAIVAEQARLTAARRLALPAWQRQP